jgi:hypothetical protein
MRVDYLARHRRGSALNYKVRWLRFRPRAKLSLNGAVVPVSSRWWQ